MLLVRLLSVDPKNRTFKAKTPVGLIVGIVIGSIVLLSAIFYAVWYSGVQIADAKKTGTIVAKNVTPQTEETITLGKGGLSNHETDGVYTLTVEVKQRDGRIKTYTVWVNKKLYESLNVGDSYDVGPALVPE